MRRALVHALIWACELQDWLRLDRITHSHRLAVWSADLDERWNTGVWNRVERDGQ
jgi:hypothetical protein